MPPVNQPPIHVNDRFIGDPAALFAWIQDHVDWDTRMKARMTASFGVSYDYAQMSYEPLPMPAVLRDIADRVESELGFLPNNCLLNRYPDGQSSMGFHSDEVAQLVPGTGVAIVSVGATRSIAFRLKADKAVQFDCPLPAGSLLYMSDQVQQDWLHAIPRDDDAGERISLTFRALST